MAGRCSRSGRCCHPRAWLRMGVGSADASRGYPLGVSWQRAEAAARALALTNTRPGEARSWLRAGALWTPFTAVARRTADGAGPGRCS